MNNLQLKIILSAVDKLLAPMKRNLQGSKQLADGLRQAKKTAQELNNQTLDVTKYQNLSRSIGVTSNELKKAKVRAEELEMYINATRSPTKATVREFERAKTAVNELQLKQNTYTNQQQRLRESLEKSGIDVKHLASEQRRLASEMQSANIVVDQQRKKLDQLNETQKRLHAARASYQKTKELQGKMAGTGAGMIATGATMSSPIVAAVKQYADFEDAMKGVAKQVNGARDDNGKLTSTYYDMAKAIKAISERLPSENGAIDIAALVEGAARMGIQGTDNLLKFAEASAKASKAFELPAGDLAENMGKIANLYKIPIKDIEQLGDVINYLDDNAQSKGSDIIDVLQRMGGVADKLDYKKAAALASTFLSLGAAREVAGTASNAMVRELSIATMQSDRFFDGLAALNLSAEKLEKNMSNDAMGTIIKVLEKVNKLKPEDQMRVTTQLFGKEYGDDAAKLANNLTELHKQLKLVNDEKAKGSMQRESDIDADSLSSQWSLLKAGIANTFSSLGSTLRSPLMDILGRVKQITIATRQWIEEHPRLAGAMLKALAVVSAITVGIGGLSLAVAAILGPLALNKLIFSTLGIKVLPVLWKALKYGGGVFMWLGRIAMANPIGLLVTALGGAAYLIWDNWEWLKGKFTALIQYFEGYITRVKNLFTDMGEGAEAHAQKMALNPALASGYMTGNYGPVISTNNYKPITMPKPTVNSSVVHAPITIVAQPGQDHKAIAKEVQKQLDAAQRNASKQARSRLSDRD